MTHADTRKTNCDNKEECPSSSDTQIPERTSTIVGNRSKCLSSIKLMSYNPLIIFIRPYFRRSKNPLHVSMNDEQ